MESRRRMCSRQRHSKTLALSATRSGTVEFYSSNSELGCLCGKAGTSHGSAHLSGCVVNGYGCLLFTLTVGAHGVHVRELLYLSVCLLPL